MNFNVLCHVKKKTSPLTLNVKAEGYAMNAQLICEDSQGNKVELTSKGTNRINLGMVKITDKSRDNPLTIIYVYRKDTCQTGIHYK